MRDPEKIRAAKLRYHLKNKEKCSKANSLCSASKRYGLPKAEILRLWASSCALCGLKAKKMCVDHCHKTLKIRGALCNRCNVMLGQVEKMGLVKIQEYLDA